MIRHFVLFTFEEGFWKEAYQKEFEQVFAGLEEKVPGVLHTEVHANCVNRPANMDLMVIMDLEGEKVLPEYLNHPDHAAMGEKYNPHVIKRVSFDYTV